ncbi:MAG: xanthine dehydrogenase family protein subunit M [Armatimonadota bacterium]|nr:xanthine dehydrogenase family protein subunit M [Armatimonadota bacterium]MDR7467344.1 xanthine dehydrogenase family protein subunit M [Armatimonadota bacterium]MDR7494114.1 xanthine dehydrogenase family protein subunit M [Armatimonadota bacterium]MDR7498919.1 xanthine dehydrogenase family protein subunit M [Armatimonadota bacterium]MDR7504371.1 xanthine dehydrogenase family protein subunit M [Armatimonadota bacterium]
MIPAQFEYHAPSSVEEALQLLRMLPDAKLLAGGHSLLPLMKLRLVTPAHLIDLGGIDGLRGVRDHGTMLTIGALTTHWTIEASPEVRAKAPLLAEAAGSIGDVQVRNFGTIGGSLAHGDPAADYPAAVLALECEIVAEGPGGRRTIRAEEFFTGVFQTALRPDEILVEVRVPVPPPRTGGAYLSLPHPASGFAVVGVAALVTLDEQGACRAARVGVTGVGPAPYRARATEAMLAGKTLTDELIAAAAEKAADGVEVNGDLFASREYRAHLAGLYTKRALRAARGGVPDISA